MAIGGINMVDAIIRYENGELSLQETMEMFSYLIKTGAVWKLQGSYGRTARAMIVDGLITPDGKINLEQMEELND